MLGSLGKLTLTLILVGSIALPSAYAVEPGVGQWLWPLEGEILTPYQNDNSKPYAGDMHRGVDIAAAEGTPVVAARSGTVRFVGELGSSGLVVSVTDSNGQLVESYLHLSAASVKEGDLVAAGREIGKVGTTGLEPGASPHLHFGVRSATNSKFYFDPLKLLPPRSSNLSAGPLPAARKVDSQPDTAVQQAPSPAIEVGKLEPVESEAPENEVPVGAADHSQGDQVREPLPVVPSTNTVVSKRSYSPQGQVPSFSGGRFGVGARETVEEEEDLPASLQLDQLLADESSVQPNSDSIFKTTMLLIALLLLSVGIGCGPLKSLRAALGRLHTLKPRVNFRLKSGGLGYQQYQ